MLYQTQRGIYDSNTNKMVNQRGENRTKKNPHGFFNGERVMGFRRGIKNKEIPHSFYRQCECCGMMGMHITIPEYYNFKKV